MIPQNNIITLVTDAVQKASSNAVSTAVQFARGNKTLCSFAALATGVTLVYFIYNRCCYSDDQEKSISDFPKFVEAKEDSTAAILKAISTSPAVAKPVAVELVRAASVSPAAAKPETSEPVKGVSVESPAALKPLASEPLNTVSVKSPEALKPVASEPVKAVSVESSAATKPVASEPLKTVSVESPAALKPLVSEPVKAASVELPAAPKPVASEPVKAVSVESPAASKPVASQPVKTVSVESPAAPKPVVTNPVKTVSAELAAAPKPQATKAVKVVSAESPAAPKPVVTNPVKTVSVESPAAPKLETLGPVKTTSVAVATPVTSGVSNSPVVVKAQASPAVTPASVTMAKSSPIFKSETPEVKRSSLNSLVREEVKEQKLSARDLEQYRKTNKKLLEQYAKLVNSAKESDPHFLNEKDQKKADLRKALKFYEEAIDVDINPQAEGFDKFFLAHSGKLGLLLRVLYLRLELLNSYLEDSADGYPKLKDPRQEKEFMNLLILAKNNFQRILASSDFNATQLIYKPCMINLDLVFEKLCTEGASGEATLRLAETKFIGSAPEQFEFLFKLENVEALLQKKQTESNQIVDPDLAPMEETPDSPKLVSPEPQDAPALAPPQPPKAPLPNLQNPIAPVPPKPETVPVRPSDSADKPSFMTSGNVFESARSRLRKVEKPTVVKEETPTMVGGFNVALILARRAAVNGSSSENERTSGSDYGC